MKTIFAWTLAPLAALSLAACGDSDMEASAPEPSNRTLAATVDSGGDYRALSQMIENAGLETALEGVGPYTLFAPPSGALTGGAADFTDPELSAESAALIQSHIVPGTLTRDDIYAAIDDAGGAVQMRTMSGGLLTFSDEDGVIRVTAPDGATATLTGDEELVSNGALQPVDGLLMVQGELAAAG